MDTKLRAKLIPFSLTAIILLLDQVSKAFIVAKWPKQGVFISDVFNNDLLWIIHVRNKAIAFSLGDTLPGSLRTVFFIALPLIVLGLLVWYYLKTDEFVGLQRWAIAGIVGGGAGNLIDRILRPDGVVDFISVNFYGLFGLSRWPTFNVADSSVVICGLGLFATVLFTSKNRIEEK
ncbi:signal peptidase II [Treponema sp.]